MYIFKGTFSLMRETNGRNPIIKHRNYYKKLMHAVAWTLIQSCIREAEWEFGLEAHIEINKSRERMIERMACHIKENVWKYVSH